MSTLTISRDVAKLLPQMLLVVVVAKNINNEAKNDEVTRYVETASKDALAQLDGYPNAQSHPRIALYRNTLKEKCNVQPKKFPQSNESLYKRLMKDKTAPRPISPVVDFYNAVSIKYGVTAGAFDLDDLSKRDSNFELRMTTEGDTFRGLDAAEDAEPTAVGAGELAYTQGTKVLTRHLAWRQSLEGLVTPKTTNVVFVSEIFGDADAAALAEQVAKDLTSGLEGMFNAEVKATIMHVAKEELSAEL